MGYTVFASVMKNHLLRKLLLVIVLILSISTGVFLVGQKTNWFGLAAGINLAVNPDQCRQGKVATTPQIWVQCTTQPANLGWVNGNAGSSNSHYLEGESISYRINVNGTGMSGHKIRLIIGYETTKSSRRAIDFLTSNNRWQTPETNPSAFPDLPCNGISGCFDPPVLAAIPPPPGSISVDPAKSTTGSNALAPCIGSSGVLQPATSFNTLPPDERKMAFYGISGNPSLVYYGPATDWSKTSDQTQKMQIEFVANTDVVVLAFGGHIANRMDWGCANGAQSAGGISGSPYHLHTYELAIDANNNGSFDDPGENQSIGNQDLQLSADAVVVIPEPTPVPTLPAEPTPTATNTPIPAPTPTKTPTPTP